LGLSNIKCSSCAVDVLYICPSIVAARKFNVEIGAEFSRFLCAEHQLQNHSSDEGCNATTRENQY